MTRFKYENYLCQGKENTGLILLWRPPDTRFLLAHAIGARLSVASPRANTHITLRCGLSTAILGRAGAILTNLASIMAVERRLLNCSMFIERKLGEHKHDERIGWIEVICGCMFSGKTEELIRRLNRALIAKQKVEIFKPVIDKRYHHERIVSHNKNEIRSTPVNFASDIILLAGDCDVVGIDEAQFFDEAIVEVCNTLANNGKRVIVAGLDMDYEGKPFGSMPYLLAVAEFVTKVHAICAQTGDIASFSYRLSNNDQQVMLGELGEYEARSRRAFVDGMKSRKNK